MNWCWLIEVASQGLHDIHPTPFNELVLADCSGQPRFA
jgi:hypothetical protein